MSSCGMMNSDAYATPSSSVSRYSLSSERALNRDSVSSANRIVVKKGKMNLKTNYVRKTGERIEEITLSQGGHVLSYSERDDDEKNASFSVRIPAQNLVGTMDAIAELGNVSYRKISVSDETSEAIAQRALLEKLKQRKNRILEMYRNASSVEDKLELEKTLAEIEEEIFSYEEASKQMRKFAKFSELDLSISQKEIRGPLGATVDAVTWTLGKLFTIRE